MYHHECGAWLRGTDTSPSLSTRVRSFLASAVCPSTPSPILPDTSRSPTWCRYFFCSGLPPASPPSTCWPTSTHQLAARPSFSPRASPPHRHADCLMPKRYSFSDVCTLFSAGCVGQLSAGSIWGSLQLAASAYLLSCYRICALLLCRWLRRAAYIPYQLARLHHPTNTPSLTVDPRTELFS